MVAEGGGGGRGGPCCRKRGRDLKEKGKREESFGREGKRRGLSYPQRGTVKKEGRGGSAQSGRRKKA